MSSDSVRKDAGGGEAQVLIIGAGPAGLFAANELMRHGVKPRIVERRPGPHHETRGTALQPAVLETLDKAGVVEPFLSDSVRIREIELMGPGLSQLAFVELAGVGSQYEFQCSQPQWRTEAVFRDRLAQQGLEVEFGTGVVSIEPDDDGVTVALERDGRVESIRAAYLLGAGGGHGPTRASMDEHLDGETYGGRYIVADVKAALPCPPGRGRVVVGPTGFVLLSPLPEGRFLLFVNRDQQDTRTEPPSEAELAALVNTRVGVDTGLSDLRWVSYFRMQRRVAPRLGDARRFLLGDAGHLSSPMGGEGINSALMDGADIAWKLALVLHGAARPTLLDSYAIERGLADRHVLEVSNEVHNMVMQLVATCAGGGTPSLPAPTDAAEALAGLRRRSMLDVSYAGSPLVETATDGSPSGSRFANWTRLDGASHHLVVFGDAPGLADFRARWGALVSVAEGRGRGLDANVAESGVVLVRPDGFVGFRRARADEAAMTALDAHLATYLVPDFADAPG